MAPALTDLLGTHGLFYLYSVLTIFVASICYFAMPDTTGLSLEEIENIYKKKHKSVNCHNEIDTTRTKCICSKIATI